MNRSFHIGIKPKSNVTIGKGFRSRNNISIRAYNGGKITLGDNCFFNDNCSLNAQKNITVGNHVILGQNVNIFDHDHDYKSENLEENFIIDDVVIGNNVWIGANSVILRGSRIGDNVVVAAGTVVKGVIEADSLVYDKREKIIKVKK
ncbi:MAG: acyltransferase [Treponema sp.]|nr:acyltransferase [Treponema sp.]